MRDHVWRRGLSVLTILVSNFLFANLTFAQAGATDANAAAPAESQTLTNLRDAFVKKLAAAGGKCPIAPPKLLLQNVKSWGNYDPDTNTLTTPLWSQLGDADKSLFLRMAGPNATDDAAHTEFETGIHHWVFIHEMGHWAQTCMGSAKGESHYRVEYGANRIALAYWRERDPALIEHMIVRFRRILQRPSPVPEGQTAEEYFNANYEKLAGTPAYTWFQAQMVNAAYEEKPEPSFQKAVGIATE